MKYPTEQIYVNLLTLMAAAKLLSGVPAVPGADPAFITASRRLPQVSAVAAIQQPALFFIEGEEDVIERVQGAQFYEMHMGAVILFRNLGGPLSVTSTQMNALRDAFIYQLQQSTLARDMTTVIPLLGGQKQTLGGVVYHARVRGRMLKNEGLQNGQGAIVVPVSILQPM